MKNRGTERWMKKRKKFKWERIDKIDMAKKICMKDKHFKPNGVIWIILTFLPE